MRLKRRVECSRRDGARDSQSATLSRGSSSMAETDTHAAGVQDVDRKTHMHPFTSAAEHADGVPKVMVEGGFFKPCKLSFIASKWTM